MPPHQTISTVVICSHCFASSDQFTGHESTGWILDRIHWVLRSLFTQRRHCCSLSTTDPFFSALVARNSCCSPSNFLATSFWMSTERGVQWLRFEWSILIWYEHNSLNVAWIPHSTVQWRLQGATICGYHPNFVYALHRKHSRHNQICSFLLTRPRTTPKISFIDHSIAPD